MTENERAATFIGWKPELCPFWLRSGDAVKECPECYRHPNGHYTTPAPDMSDPRNYMQAKTHWLIDTYQGSWSAFSLDKDKEGYGLNAVSALAALYDAEHSK